jgi:hypothetical protein
MPSIRRLLSIALFCLFAAAIPAGYAAAPEDAQAVREEPESDTVQPAETPAEEEAQDEEALEEQGDAARKTYEMVTGIVEKLKPAEQKHFFMIYTNYNLIGTVRVVQADVSKAIDACSQNNPDMEDRLRTRFKDWNGAVDPVLKEADANLNNMVLAQDYLPQKKIKAVFKSVDDTRMKTTGRIEKKPVTTKDACEYLLGKMDETQETMISILRDTLVTFPQAFPDAETESAPEKPQQPEKEPENKSEAQPDTQKKPQAEPAEDNADPGTGL